MTSQIKYADLYGSDYLLYSEFYPRIAEEVLVISARDNKRGGIAQFDSYTAKFYLPDIAYNPRYSDSKGKLLEMKINDSVASGVLFLNPSLYSDKTVVFSGQIANERHVPEEFRDEFFKMAYTEAYYGMEDLYAKIISERLFRRTEEQLVRGVKEVLGFFYDHKSDEDDMFHDHTIVVVP